MTELPEQDRRPVLLQHVVTASGSALCSPIRPLTKFPSGSLVQLCTGCSIAARSDGRFEAMLDRLDAAVDRMLEVLVPRPVPAEVAAELVRAADFIERHGYLSVELATEAVRKVLEPCMGGPLAECAPALRRAAGPGDVSIRAGAAPAPRSGGSS